MTLEKIGGDKFGGLGYARKWKKTPFEWNVKNVLDFRIL
jgi:hypothetical protein